MAETRNDLSAAYVRSILSYDPLSGDLRWIKKIARKIVAGSIAGCCAKSARRRIRIDGRLYLASRLIWLIVTGEWPHAQIDHLDLDKSNDPVSYTHLTLPTIYSV